MMRVFFNKNLLIHYHKLEIQNIHYKGALTGKIEHDLLYKVLKNIAIMDFESLYPNSAI